MNRLILILSFLYMLPLFGVAVNCPTDVIKNLESAQKPHALYKWAFSQGYYYSDGYCAHNVWRFLNLLEACGVDISSAQVLYMSANNDKSSIVIDNDRTAPPARWDYHVVLSMGDSIFDASYGTQAEVPSALEYFKRQLGSYESSEWSTLTVRVANAKKYADLFNPGFSGSYTYRDWLNPDPDQDLVVFRTGQSWLRYRDLHKYINLMK